MNEQVILQTIEQSGIIVSPIIMKGPVGLVAKQIHKGIIYEAVESQIVRFDRIQDLLDECKILRDQGVMCFKPYIISETSVRGAFLSYVEITQQKLREIISDLSMFYDLNV